MPIACDALSACNAAELLVLTMLSTGLPVFPAKPLIATKERTHVVSHRWGKSAPAVQPLGFLADKHAHRLGSCARRYKDFRSGAHVALPQNAALAPRRFRYKYRQPSSVT
eukprot:365126-Chlamydomonas_euryale.AAC.45